MASAVRREIPPVEPDYQVILTLTRQEAQIITSLVGNTVDKTLGFTVQAPIQNIYSALVNGACVKYRFGGLERGQQIVMTVDPSSDRAAY